MLVLRGLGGQGSQALQACFNEDKFAREAGHDRLSFFLLCSSSSMAHVADACVILFDLVDGGQVQALTVIQQQRLELGIIQRRAPLSLAANGCVCGIQMFLLYNKQID
jgi:hypothetical protein